MATANLDNTVNASILCSYAEAQLSFGRPSALSVSFSIVVESECCIFYFCSGFDRLRRAVI
jgi:hypothetical protein